MAKDRILWQRFKQGHHVFSQWMWKSGCIWSWRRKSGKVSFYGKHTWLLWIYFLWMSIKTMHCWKEVDLQKIENIYKSQICFQLFKSDKVLLFRFLTVGCSKEVTWGHLGLWEIVMAIFYYSLVLFTLNNKLKIINRLLNNKNDVCCGSMSLTGLPLSEHI